MKILRAWLMRFLELDQLEVRMKDVERHFVTKRDEMGKPVETLADVPVKDRKKLQEHKLRGLSIQQIRQRLEETDGGRIQKVQ